MNKSELLNSANQLKQVEEKVAMEYAEKSSAVVVKMDKLMLERADIKDLVGEINLTMMRDNHANHARFMAAILKTYNAEMFVETILWVFRAYRSRGFSTNYWAALMNTWIGVMKEELTPETFREVYPWYEWMQVNIPAFVILTDIKQD